MCLNPMFNVYELNVLYILSQCAVYVKPISIIFDANVKPTPRNMQGHFFSPQHEVSKLACV